MEVRSYSCTKHIAPSSAIYRHSSQTFRPSIVHVRQSTQATSSYLRNHILTHSTTATADPQSTLSTTIRHHGRSRCGTCYIPCYSGCCRCHCLCLCYGPYDAKSRRQSRAAPAGTRRIYASSAESEFHVALRSEQGAISTASILNDVLTSNTLHVAAKYASKASRMFRLHNTNPSL